MASKRKPLEDARKRVKEKLNAIDEQKDFIQNSVEQLTCGVKHAANSLLTESNRTKFFQKYRAVSQELEKCLDDLLLISDAISSLEDGDEEESNGSEDDDKPPNDLSSPACHEENTFVENSPENNDLPECSVNSLQTNEKTSLISLSNDTTKDLIDFETQSLSSFEKERVSNSSYSSNHSENGRTNKPSHALNGIQGDVLASNDYQNFDNVFKGSESDNLPRTDTINKQASSCFELIDISDCKPTGLPFLKDCQEDEINSEQRNTKEQAKKQTALNSRRDSTSYVNDLFMSNPPLNLTEQTEVAGGGSRRGSFTEESGKTLDLSCKNVSGDAGNETECGSPTAVRLQRIGFCEYKSQKSFENEETASDVVEMPVERDKYKLTLDKSKEAEIVVSENEGKVKTTGNNNGQNKITSNNIEKRRTTATERDEPTVTSYALGKGKIASHQSEKSKLNVATPPSQTTEKTQECVITSTQSNCEISGQFKLEKASCKDVELVQNLKAEASVEKAGDVIEAALTDKSTCKLAKEEGLQIPLFVIPKDNCLKVIVKEILSPKDFWIQKATDDLDLLMEKMCYHFSKRAKSGDKGGLQDLPCIGHVCCGRYTVDDVWYRAVVTAVSHENNHVTVLYVDEGNSETLPLSRLRELDEKFATLPCQAMRVQLRGQLELSNDITLDEVNDWFKRRVSGETLEAVFDENQADINPFPLDLYIRPHSRTASDVEYQKLEYNIHEMLIREGFAVRAASPQRSGTSDDVSPPSSPSDQVVKSESIISSSVTSGFHDAPSPTLDVSSQSSPGCQDNSVACRVPPPNIPVDSDGSVYMLVSHVVSPGEFYVHLISSESGMLDNLMDDMNQTYKDLDSQNSENFSPRVGDFCCAKFSADGYWYRGLILQVRCAGDSDEKVVMVEVFYIDFGNVEEVNSNDIRELLPPYLSMPAQVVRCSLADVNPSIEQECSGDVFDDEPAMVQPLSFSSEFVSNSSAFVTFNWPRMTSDITTDQDDDSGRRSSRQRSRRHKIAAHTTGIVIAAGDEDSDDEFLNRDMDLLGQLPDIEKQAHRDRLRSSISDDIAKSHREPSLFSDAAVELFEKNWSGVQEMSLLPSWSENATEYFKTLTLNARRLIGYIVPWDSTMLNNIVNYSQSGECSLPNLGPVLRLNLYDVSGESDVFINAVMVRAKYASSNSIKGDIIDEVSFPVTENSSAEAITSFEHVPVIRVSQNELSEFAKNSQSGTDVSSMDPASTNPASTAVDPSPPSSAVSSTTKELDTWNPMACDFESYRNAYNVEPDNVDVAISGYVEDRNKICRFYRTKYGCYRGSRCPDQHIEQDISDNVLMDVSCNIKKKLPAIGSWILVKITTIYHPQRFWVHLPAGFENLTSQLIQSRSGKKISGEENLKEFNNMMEEMSKFYSKMFRRERSLIPPIESELVVVRSEVDNRWYRGKVGEKIDSSKCEVSFVDYGITEWIDRSSICPIIPQFLHLPSQSFECGMFNIAPKTERWTDVSRQHFKSLIEGKILVCQIVSIGLDKTFVNLFDNDNGESRSVAEQMVESGHAVYDIKI